MIAVAVVAVVFVIAVATFVFRAASARAERRSVRSYEHVLDVLGDVSSRSEHKVETGTSSDEVGRAHVRTGDEPDRFRPAQNAIRDVPPPRVHLEPPVLPGQAPHGIPVFDDVEELSETALLPKKRRELSRLSRSIARRRARALGPRPTSDVRLPLSEELVEPTALVSDPGETIAAPVVVATSKDVAVEEPSADEQPASRPLPPSRTKRERTATRPRAPRSGAPAQEHVVRKTAAGAAAAVAVGALAIGGWQLFASGVPSANEGGGTPPSSGAHQQKPTGNPSNTPPPVPSSYEPLSTSASIVAFSAPGGSYKVTFDATDASWIGIERTPGGSYLWMDTLQAGQTASYTISGAIVIRLGAPRSTSIALNGVPVELPQSMIQPYDATFTPSTGVSSSA